MPHCVNPSTIVDDCESVTEICKLEELGLLEMEEVRVIFGFKGKWKKGLEREKFTLRTNGEK